jgi:hypothetical protein
MEENRTFIPSAETRTTLVSSVMEKLKNNKLYIGIGIFVVLLGCGLYYYFIKNKSDTMLKLGFLNKLNKKENNENNENNKNDKNDKNDKNESIVLDANGNPIKVLNTTPEMQEQLLQQHHMQIQQQMQQQLLTRKNRLQHPNMNETVINDLNDSVDYSLNNIEDPLVTMQDLTNSELKEIEEDLSNQ